MTVFRTETFTMSLTVKFHKKSHFFSKLLARWETELTGLAPVSAQAGMFLTCEPENSFSMRSIWYKRVLLGMPLENIIFANSLSKQTAANSNSYSWLNRHLSPGTMENAIRAY